MQIHNALTGIIKELIEESPVRALSFQEYMEHCLYHPRYGYYMNDKEKIGRSGDFYTSSAIGGLFGEVLAHYVSSEAEQTESKLPLYLVEWGGGTGRLARQVLDELQRSGTRTYERLSFISIEASPHHRALQASNLLPHKDKVQWMTEQEWLTAGTWNNVIIYSNELIDAFPVHGVQILNGRPFEVFVEWDPQGDCIRERLLPLEEGRLSDYIGRLETELLEGQRIEVNLKAGEWIRRIAGSIGRGRLITIDYGDLSGELYAPHRMNGTLMCYRNHRAEDNPYLEPGRQDITSHVNFSDLIREGDASGLELSQYVTQKQFLVENGLLQKLQDTISPDPFSPEARRNRAIRQLLLSDQMSELFKVLIQKKGELL